MVDNKKIVAKLQIQIKSSKITVKAKIRKTTAKS